VRRPNSHRECTNLAPGSPLAANMSVQWDGLVLIQITVARTILFQVVRIDGGISPSFSRHRPGFEPVVRRSAPFTIKITFHILG